MKRNKLFLAALLTALAFSATFPAKAISASQVTEIKEAVARVPVPELPPKAADIVLKAADKEREEVGVAVVRAVIARKPASAAAVVGAISKVAPQVSAAVAAEAATLSSDQAPDIAKAAAAAAPAQASKIATAVAKATPKSAANVTRAVVSSVPMSASRVISDVMVAVPSMKSQIERDMTAERVTARGAINPRLSGTSAAQPGGQGTITTVPGTIRGQLPPQPPVQITPNRVLPGRDPRRDYASP